MICVKARNPEEEQSAIVGMSVELLNVIEWLVMFKLNQKILLLFSHVTEILWGEIPAWIDVNFVQLSRTKKSLDSSFYK